MRILYAIAALSLILAGPVRADDWLRRPDPSMTPGVTRDLSLEEVCSTKWGHDERAVTAAMKNRVFDAYHIAPEARHANGKATFEIDHLISRELAGADDERNLWPEPFGGPCGARSKDRLENRLHAETCQGTITLKAAQDALRRDWIAAYEARFGSCQNSSVSAVVR
jgi:hypothetical protein